MQKEGTLISRTVWILAMVSLFADFASEMLYPIIPVYLRQTGFSVAMIGLLEGIAELTVGISKGYFGQRSDTTGRRVPFVRTGYFLSAISKPMMAVFTFPWWIFMARFTDRLGKGVRTAARDAILSDHSTPSTRARVFGFHRGWDTVGAIAGPLAALAFLHWFPGEYRTLFFFALVPGLAAVGLTYLLRHEPTTPVRNTSGGFFSYFGYWKRSGPSYKKLVVPLLVLAIANSSDAFLLLQARSVTGSDSITITAYIFYNIIYAATAYPMGVLADRWGYRKTMIAGWLAFALVYAGFAMAGNTIHLLLLFFLYGLYAAATEGLSKAWISNLARKGETATAIGFYQSAQSVCTLVASTLTGLLWSSAGAAVAFLTSASIACIALLLLVMNRND